MCPAPFYEFDFSVSARPLTWRGEAVGCGDPCFPWYSSPTAGEACQPWNTHLKQREPTSKIIQRQKIMCLKPDEYENLFISCLKATGIDKITKINCSSL